MLAAEVCGLGAPNVSLPCATLLRRSLCKLTICYW